MRNIPQPNLTPRQVNGLKRIADGFNVEVETFCELMHMDLADSELDDDGDNHDILTQKGWKLLRQIEVIQS